MSLWWNRYFTLLRLIGSLSGEKYAFLAFNVALPQDEFLIPGDNFYQNVLGWNETQQMSFKNSSLEYFSSRFGVENPESNPDLVLMLFQVNPAVFLRTYMLTGEEVPAAGLETLSAGWVVRVVHPNGIRLKGAFDGRFAQYGTTFSKGHWLIKRKGKPYLVWEQQDYSPGSVAQYAYGMTTHGEIDVTSPEWGKGKSKHSTRYTFNQQNAHAIFNNLVTFAKP